MTGRAWTFPGALGGLLKHTTYRVGYAYDAADNEVSLSYQDGVSAHRWRRSSPVTTHSVTPRR
ncbi:hypothetical protein GCM10022267_81420 [Lentzea roselyniae]|uniref:YD repeat-containing protein n=1 Tax=Lentzea roselyniae TaxID=531940 RepID=A0ABP7CBC8_9PSEU